MTIPIKIDKEKEKKKIIDVLICYHKLMTSLKDAKSSFTREQYEKEILAAVQAMNEVLSKAKQCDCLPDNIDTYVNFIL